ncbi:MAG: zinc ribbon domain-containing protein [Xenococcaceae cyanobacterium]
MLAGHLCYGRAYKQAIRHEKDWDIRYNQFPALISDVERREILQLLKHNAAAGRAFSSEFIFPVSGLVYCAECRGKCRVIRVGRPKNFSFSYQCINYRRARSCTQKPSIKEKTIIEAVIDALTKKSIEIAALAATPTQQTEPPELQKLRTQLAGLQALGTNQAIELAIAELKRQIQEFETQLEKQEEYTAVDRQMLISVFCDPLYFKSLNHEGQRRVFHGLVEKVLVRDGAIVEIRLKV